jgi:PIN domain nuclease of toxin-antitoxin system
MLAAKRRLQLRFPDWLAQAGDDRMISVIPLDIDVILALDALPKSFHGDPADRLIVATARARKLPLATRDATIRKSRTVKLWKV